MYTKTRPIYIEGEVYHIIQRGLDWRKSCGILSTGRNFLTGWSLDWAKSVISVTLGT